MSYSLFAPFATRLATAIPCLLATIILGVGCFAQTSEPPPSQFVTQATVVVALTPSTARLNASTSLQLKASVSGSTNRNVRWTISPQFGSISSTGVYTSPSQVQQDTNVTVRAISLADSTKSATVNITVQPIPGDIKLTADRSVAFGGESVALTAQVTNMSNKGVTWSIVPVGQKISSSGSSAVYTVPSDTLVPTQVTVTARSISNPLKIASLTFTAQPRVSIVVAPSSSILIANQSMQFSTTVSGTANKGVVWSLEPIGAGTLSASGLYRAPATIPSLREVKIKATSVANPRQATISLVRLTPSTGLSFTVGPNGLTSLIYKGIDYNLPYGEGFVTSLRMNGANVGASCSREFSGAAVTHTCLSGSAKLQAKAEYAQLAADGISVKISLTNQSSVPIEQATFSTLGLTLQQFDMSKSRSAAINSSSPIGLAHHSRGRVLIWLESPGADASITLLLSGNSKIHPKIDSIAPGQTKVISVAARFTDEYEKPFIEIAPEAYEAYSKAYPSVVNWPDRRPILAWWIAEGSKKSPVNPRGYFQNPLLNAADDSAFRKRAIDSAVWIRNAMDALPVRPQGILVWDLEGQEFIHPTTYIGDPRVFESGYASEMNKVANDMLKVFTEGGYRVGLTIRPQFLNWGTQLPPTCNYSVNHDYRSYYIKVDNPYQKRFYSCVDPGGKQWTVFPDGNGGQTVYNEDQILEVEALLKKKVEYAYKRWGATLFYIDSAVWSGGRPLQASIIENLQKAFPDCLFMPEQETIATMRAAIPYTDPRVAGDAKAAPVSWRWMYPTSAMMVALGDCQGKCWQDNVDAFKGGQKTGDIALYAQPGQMNQSHLMSIQSMIQSSRREASNVTVIDRVTSRVLRFAGDITSVAPYPVKLRVYFASTTSGLKNSSVFCESGQWMGENQCTLDLSNMAFSEIRYYDFTNKFVKAEAAIPFR